MTIELPIHTAVVARDAVAAQLQLMLARAAIDQRWRPEALRLEGAHVALTRIIDAALAASGATP